MVVEYNIKKIYFLVSSDYADMVNEIMTEKSQLDTTKGFKIIYI